MPRKKETVSSPPFKLPDRYEFTGTRYEGGEAFVYICKDRFLDRQVAVKVPRNPFDPSSLRMELAALCEIKSRHITEIYDLVEATRSAMFGIVEEFVPGPNLEQYAQNTQVTPAGVLNILYQIACGLSDIHQHGKVHRDVTPRNLKFDAENVVKILDFGITSDADPEGVTTRARGTPGFLAPEFYGTRPVCFTAAADTYAFGATAWFLVKGAELPAALRHAPPQPAPSFSAANVTLPPEVVALLDRTLAPDPKIRPKMLAVREVLKKHLLHGRHRLMIHYGGRSYVLSERGKSLKLQVGSNTITIGYNGLEFVVGAVGGDVYINNSPAVSGEALPDSCVVTLGAHQQGRSRQFVPVNMSHPEVVL